MESSSAGGEARLVISASFSSAESQAVEPDAKGCKDHPLFTRLQNMRLATCRRVDSDEFDFKTGKGTTVSVEGKRFEIKDQMPAGLSAPSPVAIIRNHQQAIAGIGGASG